MRLGISAGLTGLLLAAAPPVTAQSLNLTNATLQLWEQDGGFLTPGAQRMYTYRFDATRSHYIAGEITLTYDAAKEGTSLAVACTIAQPDGKAITGMFRIPIAVAAKSTTASGGNMLIGAPSDNGWAPGVYAVRCGFPGGPAFVEAGFKMTVSPPDVPDADIRVKEMQFFPTGQHTMAEADRKYSDRFSKDETSRIGVELRFVHPALGRKVSVPVDCYYLSPDREWFGPMSFIYETDPAATTGTGALGIGWDEPGHWQEGDYFGLCQINGRPVATGWFKVW